MGLMSDLKEFGQNFVLAAGAGIAENIKEKAKQDRADVLATAKELKTRIAKNKAAQTKVDNKVGNQMKTLITAAPGLADHPEILKNYLQTDDSYNMLLSTLKEDKNKDGYWLSGYAKTAGFDPREIYKPSKRKLSLSDIRSPLARTKPKKTEQAVSADSDSILRTLFGAGMGPSQILKEAEDRIRGSGRGTLSEGDLKYANLVASRRIAPGSAPVTIRSRQRSLSESYNKAIGQLTPAMQYALVPKAMSGSEPDASTWASKNQKFVAQVLDANARLSRPEYIEFVNNIKRHGYIDSTGQKQALDKSQLKVLTTQLPEYMAHTVQTWGEQQGEYFKSIFSELEKDNPLPNQQHKR